LTVGMGRCLCCGKQHTRGTAFTHVCDAPRGPGGELLLQSVGSLEGAGALVHT